jgi:hypothetical protein
MARLFAEEPGLEALMGGASDPELAKLEGLMGRQLPESIRHWLSIMGKDQGPLEPAIQRETGEGERYKRPLKLGFKPMLRHYRKASRRNEPEGMLFVGETIDAQDLGYLCVDPADPLLRLQEYTDEGEIWTDHGPLLEVLFGERAPQLVAQRLKELRR